MKEKALSKKVRIGRVGEIVLYTVAVAGVLSVALLAPNALQMFAPFMRKKKRAPKQEIQRNLDSLIRAGLLKKVKDKQGVLTLELTQKGKWEVLLRHNRIDGGDKKVWDRKWRVVIFDVPNSKGSMRFELRKAMRIYGFIMLQKSVWVYPYVCDDFIILLRKHLGISNDILYMTVDTIENDQELCREFNLTK